MPNALIVEDEPEANMLLSMLVQLHGYATDSAFTGGEALSKIDRDRPDIIFLDLMLPDLNGYEVCEALKARKETTLIPVVVVTARVAAENRVHCYSIGADHYVAKPYTPDQIFQAMDEAGDWLRRVGNTGLGGEFRFEAHDEGESLRHLAQLRNHLLARTPLDAEAVNRLSESLRDLWVSADAWGQAHGVNEVASLSYRVEPGRVVLTLRDLSGWFRDDLRTPAERWPEVISRGGLDEIEALRSTATASFERRYR